MYITKGIVVDTGASFVQNPLYDDKIKVRIPELHGMGNLSKSFQESKFTKDEDLPWSTVLTTKKNYASIYSILAHKAQTYLPADIVYVQVDDSSPNKVCFVRGVYTRYNDGTETSLTTYNNIDVSEILAKNVEFPEGLLKGAGGQIPDYSGGDDGTGTLGIKDALKILLIGNSYTYYNGIGQILCKLGAKSGKKFLVVRATKGGISGSALVKSNKLQYFAWSNGKKIGSGDGKTLKQVINLDFDGYGRKGKWDYVFAQTGAEKASATENSDIKMLKFMNDNKVIESNKNFILHDIPYGGSTSDARRKYHDKVVKKYKCSIVSARRIAGYYHEAYKNKDWKHAMTVMDGPHHPSPRGAYIYALCYYAKLFGVTEFPTEYNATTNYIELYNADSGNAKEFISNRWHTTKIAKYANEADTVKSSDAIKLQCLVRKKVKSAIGDKLYSGTFSTTTEENKDTKWKKAKEGNGSTVLYHNPNSDMVIFGDSRMVQMYNNKKNASFCAVWGGHYGYGAKKGLQIDSSDHIKKMKSYIKSIHSEQGSVRIFIVSTINDYEGGDKGYTSPVNCVVKLAKDLYKFATKEKLTCQIYMCSMIGKKSGKSVSPYNKKLKGESDSKKYKYLNIKPSTVGYIDSDGHFTDATLSDIFKIMINV